MVHMILRALTLHIYCPLSPSFRCLPHLPVIPGELLLKSMPVSLQLIMMMSFPRPSSLLLAMSLPFLLKFFFEVLDSCRAPLAEGSLCFAVLLLSSGEGDVSGWFTAGLGAGFEVPFSCY